MILLVASEAEVCPMYAELLEDTGIRHVKASFGNFTTPDLYSANITKANGDCSKLAFRASVVSVGATPQSTLSSIPGATKYAQPFYTREHAQETKMLLEKMERRVRNGLKPRIAIVGGGYGGVELAACVKRRLSQCDVTLLTRGPPMSGTRGEALVDKALSRLGVRIELCGVQSLETATNLSDNTSKDKVMISRTKMDEERTLMDDSEPWDAVLWTAGSGPACPVSEGILGLKQVEGSGRLMIDKTLRCVFDDSSGGLRKPPVWALGDCAQMVDETGAYPYPI